MALTMNEVLFHLDGALVPWKARGQAARVAHDGRMSNSCVLTLDARPYINPAGDPQAIILCTLDPEGPSLLLEMPHPYDLAHTVFRHETLAAMLQASHASRHVQVHVDPHDQHVVFRASLPVVDSQLTTSQVGALLEGLVAMCRRFHEVFRLAMITGEVDLSRCDLPRRMQLMDGT